MCRVTSFPMDSPDSEIVVVDGHSKARPDVVTVRDVSKHFILTHGTHFHGFNPCINPNRKMGNRYRKYRPYSRALCNK